MAGPAPVVEVVGLKALMRDLAKASDERAGIVVRYMQDAGRRAATPVAAATRSELPHVSGGLADDVRVTAARTGAAVRMGRKAVPYAGWIEFGGRRHRPHDSARTFVKDGRYLFPAARALASTSARLYSDAIDSAFEHFPWTNSTGDPHD